MAGRFDSEWRTYVPMAKRRRQGARAQNALRRAGREVAPVEVAGRRIVTTFWGEAWCQNLEAYGDYANRLPRGRTYVRNGSVIDLQIERGQVRSLVSGSEIYETRIDVTPLSKTRWRALQRQCAGNIDSLVELLRGSLPRSVMEVVTEKRKGLFPAPKEISLDCSCPDWASLCKHLAATLYGVGARLDHAPELLFTLRGVDAADLVETAVAEGLSPADIGRSRGRRLPTAAADLSELSDIFGIELDDGDRAGADAPDRTAHSAETKKPAKRKRKPTGAGRAAKKRAKTGAKTPAKKGARTGARRGVSEGARKRAARAAKSRSGRPPTSTQRGSARAADNPANPGPAKPRPKQRAVKKQTKKKQTKKKRARAKATKRTR